MAKDKKAKLVVHEEVKNPMLAGYPTLAEYLAAAREQNQATLNKMQIILERQKVAKFNVAFSGSGDSGQVDDVGGEDIDGKAVEISDVDAKIVKEYAYLALEEMPYDWVNNEGGWGELEINMYEGTVCCKYNQRIESSEYHELDLDVCPPNEVDTLYRGKQIVVGEWKEK